MNGSPTDVCALSRILTTALRTPNGARSFTFGTTDAPIIVTLQPITERKRMVRYDVWIDLPDGTRIDAQTCYAAATAVVCALSYAPQTRKAKR